MSTPHLPLSGCSTSSHIHSSPPTVWLFYFQSCPLLTTHCLAVLLPVMSTPHLPLSGCSTSSHVHSLPPTVWLFYFQSCPLLISRCLALFYFQSCPLLAIRCLAVLLPVMSTPRHPLSSGSTSSHVHSSPPIV